MPAPVYTSIYQIVRQVPSGKVVTYGQVAEIVGGCTARMVGYAMSALNGASDVPWHRVINAQGKVSMRSGGSEEVLQEQLLEAEGIPFDANRKIDLDQYRWLPEENEELFRMAMMNEDSEG